MGTWESSHREDSASESEAEDVVDDPGRPFSPEPTLPVPSPEDFIQLSIPQQFAYVKPVLIATLHGSYEPAKQRHSDFIKGGKHREGVKKNVVMRGNISVEEVRKFTQYLTWWALREERGAVAIPEHVRETHEDVGSGISADPIATSVTQDTSSTNRQGQIQLDQTPEHVEKSNIPASTVGETRDDDHTSKVQAEQIKEDLVKDNEAIVSTVGGTSIDQESFGVDGKNHGEPGIREEPLKEDAITQGTSDVERSLSRVSFFRFYVPCVRAELWLGYHIHFKVSRPTFNCSY
jgi:hypothetical protein